jgi:hypothetical protein
MKTPLVRLSLASSKRWRRRQRLPEAAGGGETEAQEAKKGCKKVYGPSVRGRKLTNGRGFFLDNRRLAAAEWRPVGVGELKRKG